MPTQIATCAERIKGIMAERGLRQADILNMVAPLCHEQNATITRSDISQYVLGKCLPADDKLLLIATALNVSPMWLAGFDVPLEGGVAGISVEAIRAKEASKKAVNKEIQRKVGGENLSVLFWRASESDRSIIRFILSKYSERATIPDGPDTGYLDYTESGLIQLPARNF